MRRLMTSEEVGEALGVGQPTVWRWADQRRGLVRPVAIAARRLLFDVRDVERAQVARLAEMA